MGYQHYNDTVDKIVSYLKADAAARDAAGGTPHEAKQLLRELGLLNITIPQCYGGAGESWKTACEITRAIAEVDSSVAHILSYHYLGVLIPYLLGSTAQREHYCRETVANGWFWANAMNPRDRRTRLTPLHDDSYRLEGTKSFCSGSVGSDMLPLTASFPDSESLSIVMVPTNRDVGNWELNEILPTPGFYGWLPQINDGFVNHEVLENQVGAIYPSVD